jgi:EAL domain-containing protein (putative c-di-GMP-specific phosphodiesterase class I)
VPGADLAQIFETMMDETLERAQLFCTTVAEGSFDLVFEPIVELKTGAIKHYEALTRFRSGHSPADTIRFAEDLELADSFDLALIMKAFDVLEEDEAEGTSIAINVSARYGLALPGPGSADARTYAQFLLGPKGQAILAAHGFSPP